MGFPRQEYWSGLPFLSPKDLPYPKIDQIHVFCIAGGFLTTEPFIWSKIYFLVTYIFEVGLALWSIMEQAYSLFLMTVLVSKQLSCLSVIHLLISSAFAFIHLSAYLFNEYLYFLDLRHSTGRKILQWKIWVSYGIPQPEGTLFSVTHAKALSVSQFTQSCPTLGNPKDCSTPGFPVHHQLLELAQTHVHWVSDAIKPSHPLSSPSLPAFNLSQNWYLFQWVSSSHQVAKVLEFQLQHQSFQWTPRTDLL